MPTPSKKEGESLSDYRSRLIQFFIHEGYPSSQAMAIAYDKTEHINEKKKEDK